MLWLNRRRHYFIVLVVLNGLQLMETTLDIGNVVPAIGYHGRHHMIIRSSLDVMDIIIGQHWYHQFNHWYHWDIIGTSYGIMGSSLDIIVSSPIITRPGIGHHRDISGHHRISSGIIGSFYRLIIDGSSLVDPLVHCRYTKSWLMMHIVQWSILSK